MNFDLSDEQKQVRDAFARFSDERIAPQAAALDEAHAFPRELFAELGRLGFFGIRYPEDVGGSGLDLVTFCFALEEVARGSLSLAGCAAMQSLMGTKFLHMLGNADVARAAVQAGAARREDRRDLHDRAERGIRPRLDRDARATRSTAATCSAARRSG